MLRISIICIAVFWSWSGIGQEKTPFATYDFSSDKACQPTHFPVKDRPQPHVFSSVILVFPDTPQINQEQPIRTALSTYVSFNTADDRVGPAWAAVFHGGG